MNFAMMFKGFPVNKMQEIFLKFGFIGITSIYVISQERSKGFKKMFKRQVCISILFMFTFSNNVISLLSHTMERNDSQEKHCKILDIMHKYRFYRYLGP